jgi:hypothetical protein
VEPSDHDLLIEISTKLDMFIEQCEKRCASTDKALNGVRGNVKDAHKRIDGLQIGGILTILLFIASIVFFKLTNGG